MIGKNGSGKSTLPETIAVNADFNAKGNGQDLHFNTNGAHSQLYHDLNRLYPAYRNRNGYFLRAESFYNVATEVERVAGGMHRYYGRGSPHRRSHDKSLLALFTRRFFSEGLYIPDEPEAAMSPRNILATPVRMKQPTDLDPQFIVTMHSHVPPADPGTDIFLMTDSGPGQVVYKDTASTGSTSISATTTAR